MIHFKNVIREFTPSTRVIEDMTFDVHTNDFVCLVGPSGSGKSTILQLIARLQPSQGGEVITPRDAQFGYVFQDASLLPWLNLSENISISQKFKTENDSTSQLQSLLQLVGLESAKTLFPHELSGGMKMRASLARALYGRPNILLLDEPFAALDEALRIQLAIRMRQIWSELKLTIVMVTHSLQEATLMSNRVLILTQKPARIASEVKIELPQIRSASTRTSAEYSSALAKVMSAYDQAQNTAQRGSI